MRAILVTGGLGFIGSNFIEYFLKEHEDVKIINLDAITYAGSMDNDVRGYFKNRYEFIKGDITNRELVVSIMNDQKISGIIHFAAESHVDNSIKDPSVFIKTNVLGTGVLLDAARSLWMKKTEGGYVYRDEYSTSRFHHVSTDEVYGSLGEEGFFTEETPYDPRSPYSASKAGSDMLVRSYWHTFGLNITISNCSNNYGLRQHDEKLIPTVIRKAINSEFIPVYGDGKNIRDWLYVLDHCKAIDLIFHKGKTGETYNVGGHNELKNIDIVEIICRILDKKIPRIGGTKYFAQVQMVSDRFGHDYRYAIDPSKIQRELGWKHEESFESGIEKTIDWYIEKYEREDDKDRDFYRNVL